MPLSLVDFKFQAKRGSAELWFYFIHSTQYSYWHSIGSHSFTCYSEYDHESRTWPRHKACPREWKFIQELKDKKELTWYNDRKTGDGSSKQRKKLAAGETGRYTNSNTSKPKSYAEQGEQTGGPGKGIWCARISGSPITNDPNDPKGLGTETVSKRLSKTPLSSSQDAWRAKALMLYMHHPN